MTELALISYISNLGAESLLFLNEPTNVTSFDSIYYRFTDIWCNCFSAWTNTHARFSLNQRVLLSEFNNGVKILLRFHRFHSLLICRRLNLIWWGNLIDNHGSLCILTISQSLLVRIGIVHLGLHTVGESYTVVSASSDERFRLLTNFLLSVYIQTSSSLLLWLLWRGLLSLGSTHLSLILVGSAHICKMKFRIRKLKVLFIINTLGSFSLLSEFLFYFSFLI